MGDPDPPRTADPRWRRSRDRRQNARSDRQRPERSSTAAQNARRTRAGRTRNRRYLSSLTLIETHTKSAICSPSAAQRGVPEREAPSRRRGITERRLRGCTPGHPFDCPDEWWTRGVLDLVGGLKEYFGPGRLQRGPRDSLR